MSTDEKAFNGQASIPVGQVRAQAVKVATNAVIVEDLMVMLHRKLHSVLRPELAAQNRQGQAFEMHSELAEVLHNAARTQDRAIALLQDVLARIEL
jgi:hypothetical protein